MYVLNLSKGFTENVKDFFVPKGTAIETKEQAVQALKRMDGEWKKLGLLGLVYVASFMAFFIFNHSMSNYSLVIAAAGAATVSTTLYALRRDELRRALASKKIEGLSIENGLVKEKPEMIYGVKDLWNDFKKNGTFLDFTLSIEHKVDHIELNTMKQLQK